MPDAKSERARADREANAAPPSAPPAVAIEQINITIASTGRPFLMGIPVGMTEPELLEVIGWMGTALRQHLITQQAKTAGGRILLPGRH